MLKRRSFRFAWSLILLAATLACGAVTDLTRTLEEGAATVQNMVTQGELSGTARALATQAAEAGYVQTAQAVLTQGIGNAQGTISAFATEHGDELAATAQAFATQVKNTDFKATLSALATEKGPEAAATLQALGTMIAGDPPDDIPVVPGEVRELFDTQNMLTYSTALERAAVIDFYKFQMPANGWEIILIGSIETETGAFLRFEKDQRTASIAITTNPINQSTLVSIKIGQK